MDQEFLKESFKVIRIQAFEQAIQMVSTKMGTTSDPRIIVQLMDELRKMIAITQQEQL